MHKLKLTSDCTVGNVQNKYLKIKLQNENHWNSDFLVHDTLDLPLNFETYRNDIQYIEYPIGTLHGFSRVAKRTRLYK